MQSTDICHIWHWGQPQMRLSWVTRGHMPPSFEHPPTPEQLLSTSFLPALGLLMLKPISLLYWPFMNPISWMIPPANLLSSRSAFLNRWPRDGFTSLKLITWRSKVFWTLWFKCHHVHCLTFLSKHSRFSAPLGKFACDTAGIETVRGGESAAACINRSDRALWFTHNLLPAFISVTCFTSVDLKA